MKINADFGAIATARTSEMHWSPSPMPGVERRMLDRIGGEVARATSLVRYAAGSNFSAHTHSGGEEFIVLAGTFQDEHGDYAAGTYVRNPIGTHHVPRSDEGCTIFVKLWQFEKSDQRQFSVDLDEQALAPVSEQTGIERAVLHDPGYEKVMLERWESGALRTFVEPGGAELLILEGSLEFAGEAYGRHDWIRLPPASNESLVAGEGGVRAWIKTGHLRDVRLPQRRP